MILYVEFCPIPFIWFIGEKSQTRRRRTRRRVKTMPAEIERPRTDKKKRV
jgi:hypothetical protein